MIYRIAIWIVVYNVAVRLWKGPEHPVNRLRWMQWKREGRLKPELEGKSEMLRAFYLDHFNEVMYEQNRMEYMGAAKGYGI